MEMNLSPDLASKLARAADRRGISAELLVRKAIERAVDYDDWFLPRSRRGARADRRGLTPFFNDLAVGQR